MKNYLLVVGLLCLGQMGCKPCGCVDPPIEMGINISYLNGAGTDLLNPATTDGIKKEDIDIYYLENGVKKRVHDASLDHPEKFTIYPFGNNNRYFLRVITSTQTNDKSISTTYISIKKYPEDTVTTEITRTDAAKRVIKTWINGELKWWNNSLDTITVIR
jgi:hypothetical protein